MSEPSFEEVVSHIEKECLSGPGYTYADEIAPKDILALIADWRKRGEALADIAEQDRGMWAGGVARAALTPQQPPQASEK